jgi:hypothetical protein
MVKELSDTISEEIPDIFFSKNPYTCQAVRPECIGWFFGSTKFINSKKLVPAIREKLRIPAYVPIGVQWQSPPPRHGPNAHRKIHRSSRKTLEKRSYKLSQWPTTKDDPVSRI